MSPEDRPAIIRKRKRRRRRRAPLYPFVALAFVVLGALWGGLWLARRRPAVTDLPAGYIGDSTTLEKEYSRFYGTPLEERGIFTRFRDAADLVSKRNLPGASAVLESLCEDAPLPVVFSDLGVVYSSLGDSARAVDMFREALVRDSEYAPVRTFLRTAAGIPSNAAEPLNREA
jgi:hypothetical protein